MHFRDQILLFHEEAFSGREGLLVGLGVKQLALVGSEIRVFAVVLVLRFVQKRIDHVVRNFDHWRLKGEVVRSVVLGAPGKRVLFPEQVLLLGEHSLCSELFEGLLLDAGGILGLER